jgi:putative flavoprotein involved in K+ transport
MMDKYDVLVIGGGQSGLAIGYYLRRSGLHYKILDMQQQEGGSWPHYWQSLRLFSPAQWSSLPGIIMPGGPDHYPSRNETIQYLREYEQKYKLPVERPVEVMSIEKAENGSFRLQTSKGLMEAKAIVSATGSFRNPYTPEIEGINKFKGTILHAADYQNPEPFKGKKVAIVGEGNSGAQILSELSRHAESYWITSKAPRFLPDHIDGRILFDTATQLYKARQEGRNFTPPSLGDIVMVAPVKEARDRGALKWQHPITRFRENSIVLESGEEKQIDAVIFCTGFRPALDHLKPLGIVENNRVKTVGTRAVHINGLWLLGYGSWTGFASATLIGVGRTARQTSKELQEYLAGPKKQH